MRLITDHFSDKRRSLVKLLSQQGIVDQRVLQAIDAVKRELFVPVELEEFAYDNRPLPIGFEQTISQPYIVALMAQEMYLRPTDTVLEIGAGSGYAAAVLSHLVKRVYSVERYIPLATMAQENLAQAGISHVEVVLRNGASGYPDYAPYDAICVAAGAREIPQSLLSQLRISGRLVIPVGSSLSNQSLIRIIKTGPDSYVEEDLGEVSFVPLIGDSGWAEVDGELPTVKY